MSKKKGLTISSFARAKASLSRLHILEVPLYTFLQKHVCNISATELHAAASMRVCPHACLCPFITLQCHRHNNREHHGERWSMLGLPSPMQQSEVSWQN